MQILLFIFPPRVQAGNHERLRGGGHRPLDSKMVPFARGRHWRSNPSDDTVDTIQFTFSKDHTKHTMNDE